VEISVTGNATVTGLATEFELFLTSGILEIAYGSPTAWIVRDGGLHARSALRTCLAAVVQGAKFGSPPPPPPPSLGFREGSR